MTGRDHRGDEGGGEGGRMDVEEGMGGEGGIPWTLEDVAVGEESVLQQGLVTNPLCQSCPLGPLYPQA